MSSNQTLQLRDLSKSPFPLTLKWDTPRYRWHDSYPTGVSPGVEYPIHRIEKLLVCARNHYPERIALRYFRTHWSYDELLERVKQVAGNLQAMGLRPGDRALIVLPNSPEYVVTWFALNWLGVEIVPANPLLTAHDLILLAQTSRAKAVFGLDIKLQPVLELLKLHPIPLLIVTSLSPHLPIAMRLAYRVGNRQKSRLRVPEMTRVERFGTLYKPKANPLPHPLLTETNIPAVLQPTGGTTGIPKIAVLTHENILANIAQLHLWCGLNPGCEVILSVLPFFHVFGSTVGMLSPIAGGSTLLLQAKFNPKRIWKVMNQWKPGVAPMVPFMFAELCEEMKRRGRNVPGMQICFSGASALPREVKEEFQERTGAVIFEGFGLSEASPVTHSNPPDQTARTGSIGVPLPSTVAKIVDQETGQTELPDGMVGELIIRGPQIMAGYLDQTEETNRILRDGWLFTGDLGHVDQEGFFTIVDRKKDMIISGGLNIFPTEIEQVLASHSTVEECAVVGFPDKKYGEKVVAYVIPKQGKHIDFDELKNYCKSHLAAYKIPRIIQQCDELPKNFLGKVRRVELRSRAA